MEGIALTESYKQPDGKYIWISVEWRIQNNNFPFLFVNNSVECTQLERNVRQES